MQVAGEREVLETMLNWLRSGQKAWLCTITATMGSSPRPVGSMMACNRSGNVIGSLSGGCVEEELVEELQHGAEESSGTPFLREYGVTAQENERLGLPCGGRLQLLVEPYLPGGNQLDALALLCEELRARHPVRRRVSRADGGMTIEPAEEYERPSLDADCLIQSFVPRMRMLLVGAGQLSANLAELAERLDYRVSVCDPRRQMLKDWNGPTEVERVAKMPDDFIREAGVDAYTVVITLTHDPRIDDMALMEALQQPAFYVGALGSERTNATRRKRLAQLDLDAQQIARLHGPVGLDIGSKKPLEIAIAILAELTMLRFGSGSERGSAR